MKRLFVMSMAVLAVASAWAQGTFTIRRPADGSRVRETVQVRIPKNSIPEGGYLGILVNGKFLEAVLPPVHENDYVYNLDTKARGIPDGEATIEAVLYMYTEGNPVVLNRSSVTVKVDNHTSIKIPTDGITLRYKFNPGKEHYYNVRQETSVSMVTQAQAQLGSRATQIPLGLEQFRYMIATQNAYNTSAGREGLLKMSMVPDKGKDYATVILSGDEEPTKHYSHEMHPIYMRVTGTGREIFSSAPTYFPWDGTVGGEARFDLFALLTLPILPSKSVSVGEGWQAAIPQGDISLDTIHVANDFVKNLPGKATLEAVEWESGHPCAKIRSNLKLGARDLVGINATTGVGVSEGEAQSIELEQIYWFATDLGTVIRSEVRYNIESLVTVGGSGSGGFGTGTPGSGGGSLGVPGKNSGGGPSAAGTGFNGRMGFVGDWLYFPTFSESLFQGRPGGIPGRGGSGGGQDMGGMDVGGGNSGGGAAGGNIPGVKMIQRIVIARIMQLEE